MESRFQRIFLKPLLFAVTVGSAFGAWAEKPELLELEPLVVREAEVREVDVDQIDTENFEIGVFGGIMHVEDFGSDTATSLRIAYHVTEDFFIEGNYGRTTLGQTSFEDLSGGSPLLTDEERDMTYYNVALGWNMFPGESFIAGRWAFKGGLYAVAGAGSTEFGGDDLFTINAGVGYQLVATDWLALHLDVRDHYFESDLLGTMEGKHNVELSGGLTFFF
ncbi:MAG: outer membrane beta-barrel protein [Candidatus Azotimanducaceae bacterium]|jgi:outer membrane beta-barrel protein